jgi:3(or 17)beta-hydroxysteroid dehydrogenase
MSFTNGRLAGKAALITGAASGLGEAMAQLFAREGAAVMVADIDDQRGQAVVAEITAAGGRAHYQRLDVTDEAAWDGAIAAMLGVFGRLDVLVNNAGIAPIGDMDMEFALWRKVMAVNLDSVFLGTRAGIRAMSAGGWRGSIINLSSTMGYVAEPTTAAYSASKGGVRLLTKAAAMHCAAKKIPVRINSLHPGMCLTPLVQGYLDTHPGAEEAQIAQHPIGHLGEPLDIAYGALYLASDESKFSTGSELVIDGGYLAK